MATKDEYLDMKAGQLFKAGFRAGWEKGKAFGRRLKDAHRAAIVVLKTKSSKDNDKDSEQEVDNA